MLKPVSMELFTAVILDEDLDKVTEMVVRQGVLHLVKIKELESWAEKLEFAKTSQQQSQYTEIEKRIKTILRRLGESNDIEKRISEYKITPQTPEETTSRLDEIEAAVNPKLIEKESLQEQLTTQKEIYKQIDIFGPFDIGKAAKGKYSFLEVVTGKIDTRNLAFLQKNLEDIPNVIMPFRTLGNQTLVLVIALKRDRAALEKALNEAALEKVFVPEEAAEISGDAKQEIQKNIAGIETRISKVDSEIRQYRQEVKPALLDFLSQGIAKNVILGAEGYFQKTERTYLISGWMPVSKGRELVENLKKLIGDRCYVNEVKPEKVEAVKNKTEKVPVLFSNPEFIKPFEMLITGYGVPEYKTIDPTIFVAISFLMMFGAMFGDVGQGLVLFIAGLFLHGNKKQFFSKIGTLVMYCGVSSMLFGFLYGSIFGMEKIIPSLWMRPLNNIISFLKMAVIFGIFMISLGIILNIINAFRNRDFIKGIFDKAGLIGGLIYWICVGLVIRHLMANAAPLNPKLILGLVGAPVLFLFLKAPAQKLAAGRGKIFHDGIATYFIETLVEVVEIFIGYLANTISYVRVAAFALAHVGLFLAVFSLADLMKATATGRVWSVVIIVLGNILILVLEGMVVTIQSIRLEYYEFFSKFFTGEGKQYKPVKLGQQT